MSSTITLQNPEPSTQIELTTDLSDSKVQKQLRTRYNLIRELISTEETFAKDLEIILTVYLRYASVHPYCEYLDPKDISVLFNNVPQILKAAQSFVTTLKAYVPSYILHECDLAPPTNKPSDTTSKALPKDSVSNVGLAVLEYLPTLDQVFKIYCTQNETQMNTFYRIQKLATPTVERWFVECQEQSRSMTQAWTLDSLLIKPVQRLLKYPLLLASMVENTPESHPDYDSLKQALKEVQECANKINKEAEALLPHSCAPSILANDTTSADKQTEYNDGTTTSLSSIQSSTSETSAPPTPLSVTFSASLHSTSAPSSNPIIQPASLTSSSDTHVYKDYNAMLLGLRDTPDADADLRVQLARFHQKYGMVKNLIASVQGNVAFIQNHFDVNSGLAHCWMNWISLLDDDNAITVNVNETHNRANPAYTARAQAHHFKPRPEKQRDQALNDLLSQTKTNLKQYRRYAMFCLTFTTASSAHLSSNRLKRRVDAEVIAPLAQVLGMFRNILAVVEERKKLHVQFLKYLQYKVTHQMTGASAAAPSGLPSLAVFDSVTGTNNNLASSSASTISNGSQVPPSSSTYYHSAADAVLFRSADRFWRSHTRLKTELPILIELCDQMADVCLAHFIEIQTDWFKIVLDATCNVCQMQPEDVARDVLLPTKTSDVKQDLIINAFHNRIIKEGIHRFAAANFTASAPTPSAPISTHLSLPNSRRPASAMLLQGNASSGFDSALTSVSSSVSAMSVPSVVSSCRNSQDLTGTSIYSNISANSLQSSTTTAHTTLSANPSLTDISGDLSNQQPVTKPQDYITENNTETAPTVASEEASVVSEQVLEDFSSADKELVSPIKLEHASSNTEPKKRSHAENAIDAVLFELDGISDALDAKGLEGISDIVIVNDINVVHTKTRTDNSTQLRDICSIKEEDEGDEDEDEDEKVLFESEVQTSEVVEGDEKEVKEVSDDEVIATGSVELTQDSKHDLSTHSSVSTFHETDSILPEAPTEKEQQYTPNQEPSPSLIVNAPTRSNTTRSFSTSTSHPLSRLSPGASLSASSLHTTISSTSSYSARSASTSSNNNTLVASKSISSSNSSKPFQKPAGNAKDNSFHRKSSFFAFSGLSKLSHKLSSNHHHHSQISNNVNASNPNLFSIGSHHNSHQHQPSSLELQTYFFPVASNPQRQNSRLKDFRDRSII